MTTRGRARTRRGLMIVVAAALAAGTLGSASPDAGSPQEERSGLDKAVDAVRGAGAVGVEAAVSGPGVQGRARAGVADLRTGSPMPWNGYVRLGSDTKTYVSTVILQLVGERKVTLDDKVEKWLPGVVRGNGNDGRRVTLRHLLRQTSGLPDYIDQLPESVFTATNAEDYRAARFRFVSAERSVRLAMRKPPSWVPQPDEQRWEYSNTNYVLAAMIIAKATGNSWEQEVHERIIEPVGLRHTYSAGTAAVVPRPSASGYRRYDGDRRPTDVSVYVEGPGDSGNVGTLQDHGRFLRALLGGVLLPARLLAEMQDTVPALDWQDVERDAAYGLGLAKRRLPCGGWVWYHGGTSLGVETVNGVSPDGRRAVVLAYTGGSNDEHEEDAMYKAANTVVDNAVCRASRPNASTPE